MKLEEFFPIVDKESRKHNIPGMEWQDIAQEVKLRLWSKFGLYDPLKGEFKAWANKVMKNRIKDLLRDTQLQKNIPANYHLSIEALHEQGLDINEHRKIHDNNE